MPVPNSGKISLTGGAGLPHGTEPLPHILAALEALSLSQQRIEEKVTFLTASLIKEEPPRARESKRRLTGVDFRKQPSGPSGIFGFSSESGSSQREGGLGSDNLRRLSRAMSGVVDEPLAVVRHTSTGSSNSEWCNGLGNGWPSTVSVRSCYENSHIKRAKESDVLLGKLLVRNKRSSQLSRLNLTNSKQGRGHGSLNPSSYGLLMNDTLSLCILLYDLLVTPVVVSWDVVENGALLLASWVVSIYWTLDLVLGFFTGFYRRGELILHQPTVCLNYLRGAFLLNLALVVGDWVSLAMSTVASDTDVGLAKSKVVLRTARVTRLLKLVRVARFLKVSDQLAASTSSQAVKVGSQVLKVVCSTLLFSHVLCCAWFLLGRAGPSDTGARWLDGQSFEGSEENLRDSKELYQYLTAFHWTAAQLTLGSSDVVPVNWCERLYSIFLLVAGLLFGSTIVAFLSAQIVQFIMQGQESGRMLDELSRFLRQNAVPAALAVRATNQVTHRLSEEQILAEDDVPALTLLSTTLRAELLHETRQPHLLTHPVFGLWAELDIQAMRQLCEKAVGFSFLQDQDVLFEPGVAAEQAYFVVRGKFVYIQVPESSPALEESEEEVRQGSWLCDAALWSNWTHVGLLEATEACQVASLQALGVQRVMERHAAVAGLTRAYAWNFHTRLVAAVPPHAPWPTDLHVPFTSAGELISKDVGLALLRRARKLGQLSGEHSDRLEKELRAGKCALQPASGGGLERTVSLVTVRLVEEDHIFLQVGKWDEAKGAKAVCQLPGSKRASDELPQAALARVLSGDLEALEPHVALEDTQHNVEHKESPQYGMPTTYLKTLHYARLKVSRGELALPVVTPPAASQPLLDFLLPRDIHALPDGKGGLALFSWLTEEERELLQEPPQAAAWQQWLATLELRPMPQRSSSLESTVVRRDTAGQSAVEGDATGAAPVPIHDLI